MTEGKTIELSEEQRVELLQVLKNRFEKNMNRHEDLEWANIQAKLEARPEKLWTLHEMERTEGEPDVVGYDEKTDEYIFYDCSKDMKFKITTSSNNRHLLRAYMSCCGIVKRFQ